MHQPVEIKEEYQNVFSLLFNWLAQSSRYFKGKLELF